MKVRAERLVKRYGPVTAVDDLTFAVEPGETFALVGPNGAGKTTTLRMLLGLSRPDSGRIAIGEQGLPPHDPEARRRLGYVPQRVEFPAGRTVAEVLGFFAELRALPPAAVGRALSRVGLEPLAARRANELSGGYTQRLSLAQALLGEPDVLVLDEPTASLDPAHQHLALRAARAFAHEHAGGVLAILHDINLASQYADRVVLLKQGCVLAEGAPAAVLTPEALGACFNVEATVVAHPRLDRPLVVVTA